MVQLAEGIVDYFCKRCKRTKRVIVLPDMHSINLVESANGLVRYSHLHPCEDNVLGLTNIQIDTNYDVRGVMPLDLPMAAMLLKEEPKPLIPSPKSKDQVRQILLSDLLPHTIIRLLYHNTSLKYTLKVGSVKHNDEEHQQIKSLSGNSHINYYESEVDLTPELEGWFIYYMDEVERHPPVRLGLLIIPLIHMFNNSDREINGLDQRIITDILRAHSIHISILRHDLEIIDPELGASRNESMISILKSMGDKEGDNLYSFLGVLPDTIKLLLNLYLLEKYDIIAIRRLDIETEEDKAIRQAIIGYN